MANTDYPVKIGIDERQALAGLLKVKPTADMPRPRAQPTTKKRKANAKWRTSSGLNFNSQGDFATPPHLGT
jgi:hypothetical protein